MPIEIPNGKEEESVKEIIDLSSLEKFASYLFGKDKILFEQGEKCENNPRMYFSADNNQCCFLFDDLERVKSMFKVELYNHDYRTAPIMESYVFNSEVYCCFDIDDNTFYNADAVQNCHIILVHSEMTYFYAKHRPIFAYDDKYAVCIKPYSLPQAAYKQFRKIREEQSVHNFKSREEVDRYYENKR